MKKTFLVPEYFLNFKCIGPTCEDTCCKDWGITIDQSTFNKYNAMKSRKSDFSKKLKSSITKINKEESNFNTYGKFVLNEKKECPFLNEERFCEIQSKFGYELLCDTCKHYPRLYSTINEYAEASLTLSCPEAARVALLNPDGISFYNTEISFFEKLPKADYNINFEGSLLKNFFYDIRIFTIKLLQNRSYTIEERLGILGVIFDTVEINKDKDINLIDLLESYQSNIDNMIYKNMFNSLDFDSVKQTQLKYLVITQKVISKKVTKSDKPYFREFESFLEGSKFTPVGKYSIDDIFESYRENTTIYYKKFMAEYDYIIENYLVDLVFKSRFPLNKSESPLSSYLNLISYFTIIRTELIGLLGFYKDELDINSVIYLIQGITSMINHNNEFQDTVLNSFYENKIDNIPALLLLFCC